MAVEFSTFSMGVRRCLGAEVLPVGAYDRVIIDRKRGIALTVDPSKESLVLSGCIGEEGEQNSEYQVINIVWDTAHVDQEAGELRFWVDPATYCVVRNSKDRTTVVLDKFDLS